MEALPGMSGCFLVCIAIWTFMMHRIFFWSGWTDYLGLQFQTKSLPGSGHHLSSRSSLASVDDPQELFTVKLWHTKHPTSPFFCGPFRKRQLSNSFASLGFWPPNKPVVKKQHITVGTDGKNRPFSLKAHLVKARHSSPLKQSRRREWQPLGYFQWCP